jgi:hypothetical protein
MSDHIARLEKLAELRAAGVLTDEEFAAEKARLLRAGEPGAATAVLPGESVRPALSAKWQKRFDFFTSYGVPLSGAGQERLRQLSFGERFVILFNIPGLLFGPFYFLFLGLWRRALTLLAFQVVLLLALEEAGVAELWQNVLVAGFWFFCCLTVNYANFLRQTTGRESWNPFEMWNPEPA